MINNLQTGVNQNRIDLAMGKIISAPKILSDTKNIGLSKAQSLASTTQVVRHKIYQIKPMQMVTSQTTASKNSIKTNIQVPKKENEKIQEIEEKQIKAISNVFGQFFKVENFRHYFKPAQTDKAKIQERNQEKKFESLIGTKSNTITRTYQPRIISLTNPQANQLTELKILINPNESTNNKNKFQAINITPSQKESSPISKILQQSVTEIVEFNNNNESYVYRNHNKQLHIEKKDQTLQVRQARYSQPDFKLLEIEARSVVSGKKDEQKVFVNNDGGQLKIITEPQINFQFSEIGDNEKIDIQDVSQIQQFINNNDFTHPLLQCQSRETFPLYEPRVTVSHHLIDENLLDLQKQQKTSIQLKPILSLGNLQPIHTQNQVVFTPSFHMEGKYSQRKFIIFEDQQSNQEITPIKTLMQQFNKSSPQKINSLRQSPIKSIVNQSPNNKKSVFTKIDDQVSQIEKKFVKFNTQNTLQIDPLSYDNGFESLQQVSNKLINEIQKQEEDFYISKIVDGQVQQEWRQRMFGRSRDKSKQSPVNKSYEINLPSPTRSSSPSKYPHYLIDYDGKSPSGDKQTKHQDNVFIRNKSPLRLPFIEHKRLNSQIKFDVDLNINESYANESKQILQLSTLPLESGQKNYYPTETRPSYPFNQSLTVEEAPSSIMQSIQNPRSNIQQIQQIREFYNYLRSRESTYYDNDKDHSPYLESLPQQYGREGKETERISRSMNKSYHNLHQIKETSKPLITVQSARNYHIKKDLNELNMMMNQKQEDIVVSQQKVPSYKDQQSINKLCLKQKKSLESVVLSFRRNNYIGDHKYFKDEVISLSQSRQNQQPHYSFIEQPKERLSIFKNQFPIETNYVTFNMKANEGMKNQFMQIIQFPIQKIEPIKVTSMNKTLLQEQKEIKTSRSPLRIEENLPTSRKIKVMSVNFAPAAKPFKAPQIKKPQQMGNFLLNSFHNASFMFNNAINNYTDTHTSAKTNEVEVNNNKKIKLNHLIDKKVEENELSSAKKKKIPIKKKNEISTKKLSINQKPYCKQQKTSNTTPSQLLSNDSTTTQSQLNKLHPQLCQTISRVNHHKEKQLHQIIKSRITERSNSQNSSLHKSFQCSKFNNQSLLVQNQLPLNEFKFYSKEICSSQGNKIGSHRKGSRSNLEDYSLGKSKNSSKSSKNSGLELWNYGLSELKSSRRVNREKQLKIFNQQHKRKDEKIIGVAKWNQNIAKYKQSRSKDKESRLNPKQNRKQNKFGLQLIEKDQPKNQIQEKMMNIEIKKYKYQVSNVQKKYFV